jgi:hypothetical protein
MTKISDLVALTGAGVTAADDLLPIVDMSAAGAARNKKITAAELKEAIAPGTAADLDVDPDDTLAADSDSLIPTQQAVKAYVDANVGGANDLDDLSDVDLTGLADGDTLVFDSGSGDFVPVPLPGGGAGGTVPDGGTTGQVLAKSSGANQDLAWVGGHGTSFPGSPASGDRFYRTDRNIEYFYDGTRWLSVQLFSQEFAQWESSGVQPKTFTQTSYMANPWGGLYDIYVLEFRVSSFNSATTAANYFVHQLAKWDGIAPAVNVGSSISGQGNTQNAFVVQSTAVNAVVASTVDAFQVNSTETGVSSSYIMPSFTYRLVR